MGALRRGTNRVMADTTSGLVTVDQLGARLRLPQSWLREQTSLGTIPALIIGRRTLYSVDAVRAAVMELAAQPCRAGRAAP